MVIDAVQEPVGVRLDQFAESRPAPRSAMRSRAVPIAIPSSDAVSQDLVIDTAVGTF